MRRYLVLFVISLACIGIALSSTKRMRSQETGSPIPNIVNRTHSFEVTDIVRRGTTVKLVLKNNYASSITAFSISAGAYSITRDLGENEHKLPPGASYEQSCTVDEGAPVITILSVILEDGSSDGDTQAATAILERQRGRRTQLIRILEHFDNVRLSSDSDLPHALSAARAGILSLPVRQKGNSSHYFEAGLHNAKEEALAELEELEHLRTRFGNNAVRQRSAEISEHNRKIAASL